MTSVIVTVPPYAPFLKEVARHPVVSGLRLNTVMPVKEPLDVLLKRLKEEAKEKEVWIDLKGRQLRTVGYWTPPFTEVRLNHRIKVNTPVEAYFGNGREHVTLVGIDGNRLLFLEGPKRVVGPGESLNIRDPSLEIEGYLTKKDFQYIEAGITAGVHTYMLSFVESVSDSEALRKLDPAAVIAEKIESKKGLEYVASEYDGKNRLMAARGDLYAEVDMPHDILAAMDLMIKKDPNVIAASRVCSSLAESLEPSCSDISDVAYLIRTGYKTLMLGDEVCLRRDSVISALNLIEAIQASG
ncbi:MAG: pyruvate kinase [Nanoarchaeota archaeon]